MRSRPSSSIFASNSLDLTLATSSGLILQICLIMALSLRCRFVLVSGQVSLALSSVFKNSKRVASVKPIQIQIDDQWTNMNGILSKRKQLRYAPLTDIIHHDAHIRNIDLWNPTLILVNAPALFLTTKIVLLWPIIYSYHCQTFWTWLLRRKKTISISQIY